MSWSAVGRLGNRSAGYARSLAEADAAGSGARIYRRTTFLHRRRSRSLSLSQVWRTNEGHRTAHRCRNPASFSTTDQLCGMKLLSPTPTLRALPRATLLSASSENKFLLAASSTTVFTTPFHRSHFLGP